MTMRKMAIFRIFLLIAACTLASSGALSQSPLPRGRNNPYSPSPTVQAQYAPRSNAVPQPEAAKLTRQFAFSTTTITIPSASPNAGSAVPADTVRASDAATVYRIDAGDVLFIGLKTKGGSGNYYTVQADGTIDLPLAERPIRARGLTTDELRAQLNDQADVRVREYNSHKVRITGLVDRPGDISLQRDAMPIFALRAQAGTRAGVEKVVITRAITRVAESYMFDLPGTDDVLVYPGDSVEFAAKNGKN